MVEEVRIIVFGDIYGRIGRKGFFKEFPRLKETYNPDFVVVNIDNITSGRGAAQNHVSALLDLEVDVLTGGDHIFDNFSDIEEYLSRADSRLLRPANFSDQIPGKGYTIVEKDGKKLAVIHLIGNVFMNHQTENPFVKVQQIISEIQKQGVVHIVIDFHKEATSEIAGLGLFLDGQVGAVFGTHTHVQTADAGILPHGTAMISDVGMNGPYPSVIGAEFGSVKKRFLTGVQKGKIEQSLGKQYVIGALFIELDNETGLCTDVEAIRYLGKI